jgi:hypothetical protein
LFVFFTITIGSCIGYVVIKPYFYPTIIQTPNSPPTYYLSQAELNEIQDILDRGEDLTNNQVSDLNQTVENILGTEDYNKMCQELEEINNQFSQELAEIFDLSNIATSGIDLIKIFPFILNFIQDWLWLLIIFTLIINMYFFNSQNIKIRIILVKYIIIIILLKLYVNFDIVYNLAYIIPLSINKITYLEDIIKDDQNNIFFFRDVKISRFYFSDLNEVNDFLINLDYDKSYIVTFDLILNWLNYELGEPSIILGKPILVSKDSNSKLISDFINEKVQIACDSYSLDENLFNKNLDGPGILVRYREINLF